MTASARVTVLVFGALLLGALAAIVPPAAVLLGVALWALIVLPLTGRGLWVAALLFACFSFPYDYVGSMSATLRGLPALILIGGALVLLSEVSSSSLQAATRELWDVWAFLGWMFIAIVVSGDYGGFREFVTWTAAAILCLAVLASSSREEERSGRHLVLVFLFVGAVLGVFAILERVLGQPVIQGLVPGYAPIVRQFDYGLGVRAVSLAGHALRLGTLEMLAVLGSAGLLVYGSKKDRVLAGMALLLSASGLLLSGARGAWLGMFAGFAVLLLLTLRGRNARRGVQLATAMAGIAAVLAVTPAWNYVTARSSGAVQSSSFAQRIAVLSVTRDVVGRHPLVGYGFRQGENALYSVGLMSPNVENDYIIMLIVGGIPLLVLMVIVLVRTLRAPGRLIGLKTGPTLAAMLVALMLNLGTYNALTWTFGPAVLLLLVAHIRRETVCGWP